MNNTLFYLEQVTLDTPRKTNLCLLEYTPDYLLLLNKQTELKDVEHQLNSGL